MLKRKYEVAQTTSKRADVAKAPLDDYSGDFTLLSIDAPIPIFNANTLQEKAKNAQYGVLKLLEGTWYSYKEPNSVRVSNVQVGGSKPNQASGVHTTIMPSPGQDQNKIPGKFSFVCQEYIEQLSFELVPGGVRNRGGASEQFCGAVKYNQTIKTVDEAPDENGIYPSIHVENGMYLWMDDVLNHPASKQSILEDQGIQYEYDANGNVTNNHDQTKVDNDKVIAAKELKVGQGIEGPYFIPDYTISRSGVIPHGSTITVLGNVELSNSKIVLQGPPKFITNKDKPNTGRGTWDYAHLAISPTMGGAVNSADDNLPSTSDLKRPFDLYNPPLPFTPINKLNSTNDPGENIVYTQRMFFHNLYPYSIRPDLRLNDAIKNQTVRRNIHFTLNSRNSTGAQGGILNIPFVNKFVPSVQVTFNMWIEEVEENGKIFLQLQYEQIVLFEFDFGDNGGTTSWPHIQVNTLRKLENLPADQQQFVKQQFSS